MSAPVKERPIIFRAPMIRAILAGTKSQTRRIVKLPLHDRDFGCELAGNEIGQEEAHSLCPYGAPLDRLWVRESFQALFADGIEDQYQTDYKTGKGYKVYYMATDARQEYVDAEDDLQDKITPSIFMPRWASRITLEVTGVRVERLQDISEADAKAEGVNPVRTHRVSYIALWNTINGAGSWESNPWVWCISFWKVQP